MKIKLISFFLGDNQNYLKLAKLSEQISQKYCDIHNYECKYFFDLTAKYNGSGSSAIFKINLIKNNLTDCDYLVFLDSDAAIVNPSIKIENLIDNEHELFLSRGNEKMYQLMQFNTLYRELQKLLQNQSILTEKFYDEFEKDYNFYRPCERLSLGKLFLNEGFIIIKNTNLMQEFFNLCANFVEYFNNRVEEAITPDGGVINFFLKQKKFNHIYTFLYPQVQGGYANSFDTKYDEDKTFILHNYGQALNFDQKYNSMLMLLQNKYWKLFCK